MILLVRTARLLMILWAAMWAVSAIAIAVLPAALLLLPLVACVVGGLAIDATHRALHVDNDLPGVPFLGPLSLCSLDDTLDRLPISHVSLTSAIVTAVFAPLWAFVPCSIVAQLIAPPTGCGNAWMIATPILVFLLFASSRMVVAFRVVRVLNRLEAAVLADERHSSHVLPVAV
jgi:hypothetical protein